MVRAPPEEGQTAFFISEQGGALIIAEEDIMAQGLGEMLLEEYGDLVIQVVQSTTEDFQLISREKRTTEQGLPAEVLTLTINGGVIKE